jgi:transcriptional regulator with XRE-family HTH domain
MAVMSTEEDGPAAGGDRMSCGNPGSGSIVIEPRRLIWYREDRGWSRAELAGAVGVLGWADEDGKPLTLTRDSINKFETRDGPNRRNPRPIVLRAICEALSILARVPKYDERSALAGQEWEWQEEDPARRVQIKDLRADGPPLPDHYSPGSARADRGHRNERMRAFAEEHCIPYRTGRQGRITYFAALRRAYSLQESGAEPDVVAGAVQYARDTAPPASADAALLAS